MLIVVRIIVIINIITAIFTISIVVIIILALFGPYYVAKIEGSKNRFSGQLSFC